MLHLRLAVSARHLLSLSLLAALVWFGFRPWVPARANETSARYGDPHFTSAQNPNDNWDGQFGVPGVVGEVSAVAVSGNDVYIAGLFTMVGGVSANNIARWNGTSWSALSSGTTGRVNALAVNGSDVYAGGFFDNAGGVAVSNIARWNGSSWSALGMGAPERVRAIVISGSNIYAGGSFTTMGGISANRIARWDGATWSALGSGLNNAVLALAVIGTDLYAGGGFTLASGLPANRIARWNGSSWSALGNGLDGSAQALTVSGGNLFVGGFFTNAGDAAAANIARWNGTTWSALGLGVNGSVNALTISGSDLFVAGSFELAGGASASNIARWNGTVWSLLGGGVAGIVYGLGFGGGNLYVGGSISSAGGKPSANVARYRNTPIANTPPMITAGTAQTRQQGSAAGNAVLIATVNDAETPAGNLSVTATSAAITITNITNTNGAITANVAANCTATVGANTAVLTVSDGTTATNANLTVNATANTPPVLGIYPDTTIAAGSTATVTPSMPPSDNGTIASITARIVPAIYIGTFSVNTTTGVITITDPRPDIGPIAIYVGATDNCGVTTTQTFLLTINRANTAPTITAAAAQARQQGSAAGNAIALATVNDTETPRGNLTVTVTATTIPNGLSLTNLINTNGTITANVAAGCGATVGANTMVLTVSDGALSATANVTINVTANTPPVLGTYAAITRLIYQNLNHAPNAPPADNGSIVSIAATASGVFGPFTVDASTGVITHLQVSNAGEKLVTVTATDNCQAITTTTFPLTINRLRTTTGVGIRALTNNVAGQQFVLSASMSVLEGFPQVAPTRGFQFFDGTEEVVGAPQSTPPGTVDIITTSLKPGLRTITARYGGDSDRLPSVSAPISFYVNYPMASVSAASYLGEALAAEQIIAAFGTNLATTTQAAATVPLPTTLAGVSITVKDSAGMERLAPLFFVSPTQVNYLIPAGTAPGAATITLSQGNERSVTLALMAAIAPGLFTVNGTGRGLPAAEVLRVLPNGALRYEPIARFDATTNQFVAVPIDLSNAAEPAFLILYGTGFRNRPAASTVTATIGSVNSEVLYAGTQGSLAGLDQANLRLPVALAGRGDVDLILTVDGRATNAVRINLK